MPEQHSPLHKQVYKVVVSSKALFVALILVTFNAAYDAVLDWVGHQWGVGWEVGIACAIIVACWVAYVLVYVVGSGTMKVIQRLETKAPRLHGCCACLEQWLTRERKDHHVAHIVPDPDAELLQGLLDKDATDTETELGDIRL